MFKTKLILLMVLIFFIGLIGCGGDGDSGQSSVSKQMSPEDLGKSIGEVYVKAMTDVSNLMKKKEDVTIIQPKLTDLKEKVIQKLIRFGKQREALETADREAVDRSIRMGISSIPMDTYNVFREGHKHYSSLDINLGNLIASFNIITQYANFGLLKKQNPDEAKRLGIE